MVDLLANGLTALVALLSVALGGYLSTRAQRRHWDRDHLRHWRDIRLSAFDDFLSAFRSYIAFALNPSAKIDAVPDAYSPGHLMPIFDNEGTDYKERMEAAKTKVRLVAQSQETLDALAQAVQQARQLAADRASSGVGDIAQERIKKVWTAEHAFLAAARLELSLPPVSFPAYASPQPTDVGLVPQSPLQSSSSHSAEVQPPTRPLDVRASQQRAGELSSEP
ncbi:hypothetical protein AB0I95_18520 [Micromonospora sp. NPDC049751]|uniref:hypothetical protein n=1 Tax=Micromonospora sp. NPDC049751 TaxID=3154837 RepID=UPI0033C4369E